MEKTLGVVNTRGAIMKNSKSDLIGYVKSIESGTFFVKDVKGNIHKLKAGEAIHKGDLVYGAANNAKNAKIIIDMSLQESDDVVIVANKALHIDISLLKGIFGEEDSVVNKDSLEQALVLNGNSSKNLKESIENDTTEAGESVVNQEHVSDIFSDRTAFVQDITTAFDVIDTSSAKIEAQSELFRPAVFSESEITVDTTAPDAPTVSVADSDGDNKPTASGTAEAGSTVTVTWPDGTASTVTADATTGAYSVEAAAAQSTGTVSVTATDTANNTGAPATATYTDTTAPSKPTTPTGYEDNVGTIQSATSTATATDDTKPGINIGAGVTDTQNSTWTE
jgi:hypothetical protein